MKKDRIIMLIGFLIACIFYWFTKVDFAAFLIGIMIVYTLLAAAMTFFSGKKIQCHFSKGTEGSKGKSAEVSLYMKNEDFLPVLLCTAVISVENKLTGSKKIVEKNFSFFPKQKKIHTFQLVEESCGCVEISILDLFIGDSLNLFKRKIKTGTTIKTEHFVLPSIFELPISKEELDQYDMESYRYSQSKRGDDPSETFGIKSYMPGDNIKAIHWKLSSKMDDLVIREFGLPVDNKVLVIADKRLQKEESLTEEEMSESTEIYLSVLYTLAKQGLQHDAGWYNYSQQEFECRKITTTDDVYALMPYVLSSPFCIDEISTAEHYLEADIEKNYASYIYITTGSNEENLGIERLRNYGKVNIYRPENFK